jgi:hypothetical protein
MGGSGGGSAGQTSWPDYLQDAHEQWLNNAGTDTLTLSVVDAMNAAHGDSPYLGVLAYDPDADIALMGAAVNNYAAHIGTLGTTTTHDEIFEAAKNRLDGISDESRIAEEVSSYSAILEDQLINETLPAFKAGMLNIGAVNSSSFAIGEAIIRGFKDRDVAKFAAEIQLKSHLQTKELIVRETLEGLQHLRGITSARHSLATLATEVRRLVIVAKKEELTEQLEIDAHDRTWDLEVYQYGANLIASISGGIGPKGPKGPSKATSAIGGALSGAAAGATVGLAAAGGTFGTSVIIGAVAGAAIGAGAGYASA